jgi:hypothetical protein
MRFFMKALTLFSVFAGLAFSATLNVRIVMVSTVPDLTPSFRVKYEIEQYPTPFGWEEGVGTVIDVGTVTVETGATKYTGPGMVEYFAIDYGYFAHSGVNVYVSPPGIGFPPGVIPSFTFTDDLYPPGCECAIGYTGLASSPMIEIVTARIINQYRYRGFYSATLKPEVDPIIPEPGTMATLAAGIVGLVLFRRRLGWHR